MIEKPFDVEQGEDTLLSVETRKATALLEQQQRAKAKHATHVILNRGWKTMDVTLVLSERIMLKCFIRFMFSSSRRILQLSTSGRKDSIHSARLPTTDGLYTPTSIFPAKYF